MNHKFKNDYIEEIMRAHEQFAENTGKSPEKAKAYIKKLSTEEHGKSILGGFYSSLVEVAGWHDVFPDPTYDSLDKLPVALTALYHVQRESYHPRKNAEIIGKTIATYMTLLCINEHNCIPKYTKINPIMYASQADLSKTWAGAILIEVGTKRLVNFYQAGLDTVKQEHLLIEGGLAVDMTPIIIAYRRATGIKLSEHGLINIMIG